MLWIDGDSTESLYFWSQIFSNETKHLASTGQKLLLVIDGYASNIAYKILHLLMETGIVVFCHSAHRSMSWKHLNMQYSDNWRRHVVDSGQSEPLPRLKMVVTTSLRHVSFGKMRITHSWTLKILCRGFVERESGLTICKVLIYRKYGKHTYYLDSFQRKTTGAIPSTKSVTAIVHSSNDFSKSPIENAKHLYHLFVNQAPSLGSGRAFIKNGQ